MFSKGTIAQVNHSLLNKPDTLGVMERLSVSTNMVEWTLLMPNISLEYDLRGVTWNRWAIGLKVKGNWQTHHTFKPALVYNILEARAEVRHYWHTRLIDTEHPRHKNFLGRLISCRRDTLKHPNTTYYRGGYLSFSKFSFLLTGTGKQGTAASVGFLYGIVKPLYQFANGNALDLDLGISGGLYLMRYDKYEHDRESDCYHRLSTKGWHILPYPMLNELRLALVYRFTRSSRHQLPERYRWRYDVDQQFREATIERVKEENRIREEKARELKNLNEVQMYFDRIFNKNYSTLLQQELKQKAETDAKQKQKEEELRMKKEQEKLEKEKAKEEQRKRKAEEKAAKKEAEEKKTEPQTPPQTEEKGGEDA